MSHFERLDAMFGCGGGNYYPEPCETCGQIDCTCDDVAPCPRCGHDVISEIGATKTDEGWAHDFCLAYKEHDADVIAVMEVLA